MGSIGTALTTARLRIRTLTAADAPFMLTLVNQASWLRFIGDRGVRSLEDAERYIADGPLAVHARHGFSLGLVTLKDTGAPIGVCGLIKRDSLPDPDLGFALLDAYAGQGLAFEAASAVLQDAFTRLGLARVLAIATPDNERSAALLRKLGFALEGSTASDGETLHVYARLQ